MSTREEKVQAAKDAAIKAVAARDLTRRELVEFLVAHRHAAAIVDWAITELEVLGVVDDQRVAEAYVRSRMDEGPMARLMVETALIERGIDQDLVTRVLDATMHGRDEGSEALEIARIRVRTSPAKLSPDAIRRRVFAFLQRRGYDEETARHAVEVAAEEYLGRP